MKHKGYCVKILHGELEALEVASILICSLGGVDSSSSNGFKVLHFIPSLDGEGAEGGWGAFRRVGTYNKNRSFQWKIENGKLKIFTVNTSGIHPIPAFPIQGRSEYHTSEPRRCA